MKVNKDLRLRRVDGKNFIVALGEKSKTFSGMIKLNDTAAEVFKLLSEDFSREEIVRKLENEYEASFDTVKKDVDDIIDLFEKAGFFV